MCTKTIAATPILLMPCSVPYRMVLRAATYKDSEVVDEYIVHTETFSEDDPTKSTGYTSGSYFYCHIKEQGQAFKEAYAKWVKEAEKVNSYIQSGRFKVINVSL